MKIITITALAASFLIGSAGIKAENIRPALIPGPQQLVWNGRIFRLQNGNRVVQRLVGQLPNVFLNNDEAYRLVITADSAVLEATTRQGLFRGLQTVNQLTSIINQDTVLTGCEITDWPAFKIRGFMLDVGRNFMPVPLLKELIDVMAAYKFNVFHLHLTDNPGWRLESKRYPELSQASSMSRWPGKYYSQQDLLELTDYCNERFITLIPELDIPGHCEAFRKAFAIDSMSDIRVNPILTDLIDELCSLIPREKMPFIHLGTDEVWTAKEKPVPDLLPALKQRIMEHGRQVIVWCPGQEIQNDSTSFTQLWSSAGKPKPGRPFIDSRLNYLNHLDPLAGVVQLYFDRICGAGQGDSLKLGGILCCWNDNLVNTPEDIIRQNPLYPGLLTYSETSWHGRQVDFGDQYLAKLPEPGNPLFDEFREFEERLTTHQHKYFRDKPFPYARQTQIVWKLIGPFDHHDDITRSFPVENDIQPSYLIDGEQYSWTGPVYGGTIHIRHFFGYPSLFSEKQGTVYATTNICSPADQQIGCWIGFQDWSRSGGRRGGPFPVQGQWHTTNPVVWVNGKVVDPPAWDHPGLGEKTSEIPFSDENYFFRKPAEISLKKGWNRVLLKIPQNDKSWKWMFTFVPLSGSDHDCKEKERLKYSVKNEKLRKID